MEGGRREREGTGDIEGKLENSDFFL